MSFKLTIDYMINRFFSIEGMDFTGKTTICKKLEKSLTALNKKVKITREPGGTSFGNEIRKLIMNKEYKLDVKTEALLFATDRSYHIENIIKPYLEKGYIVISDRYLDSSTAYQSYVKDLPINKLQELHQFTVENIYPIKTFYIDIPVDILLERRNKVLQQSNREINRLDEKSQEMYINIRKCYLSLCEKYNERFIKIDGTKSIEEIFQTIQSIILANN